MINSWKKYKRFSLVLRLQLNKYLYKVLHLYTSTNIKYIEYFEEVAKALGNDDIKLAGKNSFQDFKIRMFRKLSNQHNYRTEKKIWKNI